MHDEFLSIADAVRSHASDSPDKVAIAVAKAEITYARLWRQIVAAADWYVAAGINRGDRVLISTDSRDPFFAAAYLGAHVAAAIAVPTDYRYSKDVLAERQVFVDAKLVLFGERFDELRQVLDDSGAAATEFDPSYPFDPTETAELMFTTGSTGDAKAVALSHENILASASLTQKFIGNRRDDSEVVTVPLTHSFGLGRLRSVFLAGGKLIVVPGLVYPQVTIQAMQQHAATGLSCVPGGLRLILMQCQQGLRGLAPQIRYMELGSAPLLANEKAQLCEILPNTRLCMHYGLTEASRSTFSEFHRDQDQLDSVGQASPQIEVEVFDDNGTSVKSGKQGHIHVRGKTVMLGYWDNPRATDLALDRTTGWLNTGDLGWLDEQGYLYLAGRDDDVINCGGVKFLPNDLERIAVQFPGVVDVACVGIADPEEVLGQVPLICVVAGKSTLDSAKLVSFVKENFDRRLRTVVVKFVDKLPKTESGKILRRKLPTSD